MRKEEREIGNSNERPCIDEMLNEVADNVDGAVAILEGLKDNAALDPRIHVVIAALKRTRAILDPALDEL